MELRAIFAATAIGLASLSGCQQPPTSENETPAPATTPASETTAERSACIVSAHSDWRATLNTQPGARRTLTVEGRVELPTPGYTVTLARDPAEDPATTEPHLTLNLAPPAGAVIQAPTMHPVYYFAPASGAYSAVHIMCAGVLTAIPVTVVQ